MSDTKITFWTDAPEDAPEEIKGTMCFFRPERLEWVVTKNSIRVAAHGPATRVKHRQGVAWWSAEGPSGDERPTWLLLPVDPLSIAMLAVREIDSTKREQR